MEVRAFKVQGFKNLRQPMELGWDRLASVLRRPTTTTESNLGEALRRFCSLIGIRDERGVPLQLVVSLPSEVVAQAGSSLETMFQQGPRSPILLEAEIAITPEDFEKAGAKPNTLSFDPFKAAVELRREGSVATYRMTRGETADARGRQACSPRADCPERDSAPRPIPARSRLGVSSAGRLGVWAIGRSAPVGGEAHRSSRAQGRALRALSAGDRR
jgi:hypothetical protein